MHDPHHRLTDAERDHFRDILDERGLFVVLGNLAEVVGEQADDLLEDVPFVGASRLAHDLHRDGVLLESVAAQLRTRPAGAVTTAPRLDTTLSEALEFLISLLSLLPPPVACSAAARKAGAEVGARLAQALHVLGSVPRAQRRGLARVLRAREEAVP